jgi:NADH-quinone oxidoreductase subunit N
MTTLLPLSPILAVAVGALLVLLVEAFGRRESKNHLAFISLAVLAAAAALCVRLWDAGASAFGGTLNQDKPALLFSLLLILAAAFAVLIGMRYLAQQNAAFGEFYGILLLSLSGLMVMVATRDLLIIFLGLEVFSVSAYGLTGLKRNDDRAAEAAAKYFLMGSFAAAFMVFGLAILFGTAGSFDIGRIFAADGGAARLPLAGLAGLALILVGLAFKIALVPFHMWQPDVYQGAPTPVSGFFVVAPKTAGFLVLMRILLPYGHGQGGQDAVYYFLYAVAALTMIVGNLGALRQTNIKRLMAYSSIAHAGYILIAVLALDARGLAFYLASYLFLGIGAFAVLTAMARSGREYGETDDFAGIGFRYPWIGSIFAVILLGLAGFPPLSGFLAKFYVFSAAIRAGLVPLVIIGVLTSLISVYYYLRIIAAMYMREPEQRIDIDVENPAVLLVLFLCLYGVLQLGVFPGNILLVIRQAMAGLF